MTFEVTPVSFSLKDVGSEIIDQLSTDVYSGPASIMRELIKNAYDATIALGQDVYDDEETERRITVSRERDSRGLGHLLICDNGIGQDLSDLKANVQISISRKQQELENATGFRGLGSWAILGGGSKVVITSSKLNSPREFKLTINVKKIYGKLGSKTTLDDILNDEACISFASAPRAKADHFTTVDVICDGPPSTVNGHELNRLYNYTDPADTTLRPLLIGSCALPYAEDSHLYEEILKVYEETGYIPTPVILDGKPLERRLPTAVSEFTKQQIMVGDSLVALAWVVENPAGTGELTNAIDEETHMLGGPGLQLAKLNVPIGQKNIYGDNVRATILNWYLGEIHLIAPDVLPNAGGEGLRGGTAGDLFVASLRTFYKSLENRAEQKSVRISLVRKMRKGQEAARRIAEANHLPSGEKQQELAKIAKAVEAIEETGKKSKATSVQQQRVRTASKEAEVKAARNEARQFLRRSGYMDEFASQPVEKNGGRKSAKAKGRSKRKGASGDLHNLSAEEFQAAVGRIIPRLKRAGLNQDQVDEVLDIIQELVTA